MLDPLFALFDGLGIGVAVVAEDGHVLVERGFIAVAADIVDDQGRVVQQLAQAVAGIIGDGSSATTVIVIYRREGMRPFTVHCVRAGQLPEQGSYLMLAQDLDAFPRPKRSVLRRLFRLSPKEAWLASELARGNTIEEIAHSGGISTATARTQMKSVFLKTATNRQAELAAILSRTCVMPGTRSKIPVIELCAIKQKVSEV